MRRKILKTAAVCVAIPLVVIALALAYVRFADLSGWRRTVERLASDALGRELRIAGEFVPEIGLTTRLVATEVSLANPPWTTEPLMATVDRLDLSLELLPLLSGGIHIRELIVDGARVWLETDADGRSSWTFDIESTDGPTSGPPSIEIGSITLRDVSATYRTPALDRALAVEVGRLELAGDAAGELAVQLDGSLNGSPLHLAGDLGPLAALLSGGAVTHDIAGRLGGVTVATSGSIEQLSTLAGVDLTVAVSGPAASEVTELIGLSSLGDGPFEASLQLTPSGRDTTGTLAAALGQVVAEVEGTVDALVAPRRLDAEVSARGPDLAAAGALIGVADLPTEPFAVSGHVAWDGFPVTIDGGRLQVGDSAVSADGVVGAPPQLLGTDLFIEGSGPDLAEIGQIVGVELPPGEFSIRGHLERREHFIGLEGVELQAAGTKVTVDGTVGDPPELAGTDLAVRAAGHDLSAFSGLARRPLPAVAFEIEGRLRPTADGVAVEGVEASVGAHRVSVDGTIATSDGLAGSRLAVAAEGPELAWVLGWLGIDDGPAEPYSVAGRLGIRSDGLQLDNLTARIRDASVTGAGRLGRTPSLFGTDVTVRIEGTDASWPTALAGLSGIPAVPFDAHGRIRVLDRGLDLDGIESTVGGARLRVSGRLGPIPDLMGSDLSIEAAFPSLAAFNALVPELTLPAVPASISGRVLGTASDIRLEGVVVDVQGTRMAAQGRLTRAAQLAGSDVTFELDSPDLATAGRLVDSTGLISLPELPAEPVRVAGRIAVDDIGYQVEDIRLAVGSATAHLDGRVGRPPHFRGTDLTVASDGPNASLFSAVTGVTVPAAPFRVDGRISRLETGFRFDELRLQFGEYHAAGNGILGEPPRYEGTDLEFEASGPSLALIRELAGVDRLPDLPFIVDGHLDGDPRRFKSDRISAKLGNSDVEGSFRIDLEGARPRIEAELRSSQIDLTEALGDRTTTPTKRTSTGPGEAAAGVDELVFSDDPITLAALGRADGHLRWTAAAFDTRVGTLTDIELDARLDQGSLRIEPIRGVGVHGGRLDGTFRLDTGAHGHELSTTILLRGGRVDLTEADEDPSQWPTLDLDLELGATGWSRHQLASSADGRIAISLGPGSVDDSALDLLAADLFVQILELLNPFSGERRTSLECGVAVIELERGVATLDPFAVQTDRTTVVGDGTVDLSTEDLDLRWVTKPRKGLGVSASTITNAYLKLGGTLSKPKIETKPLEALATTGVAVATGGLSLLGKGLFDRISADKKVCRKALERAAKTAR